MMMNHNASVFHKKIKDQRKVKKTILCNSFFLISYLLIDESVLII